MCSHKHRIAGKSRMAPCDMPKQVPTKGCHVASEAAPLSRKCLELKYKVSIDVLPCAPGTVLGNPFPRQEATTKVVFCPQPALSRFVQPDVTGRPVSFTSDVTVLPKSAGNLLDLYRQAFTWDHTPTSTPKPDWLIRGYTGHEMLPETTVQSTII